MKRPIEFEDIRVGDVVDVEWDSPAAVSGYMSVRFKARIDRQKPIGAVRAFLIDRPEPPKPPVELPPTPSLGWADGQLGFWNEWQGTLNGRFANGQVSQAPRPDTYVAATAVPTSALDELRRTEVGLFRSGAQVAIADFLAAVDKAGDQS